MDTDSRPDVERTTAADRVRATLQTPVSLMGGEMVRFDIADIQGMLRENERALDEIERLRKALAFACCTIKSGERWTETCELELKLYADDAATGQ